MITHTIEREDCDYSNQGVLKRCVLRNKNETISSVRHRNNHGVLVYEERRVNGIKHSDTVPSMVHWDWHGNVVAVWWCENDKLIAIDNMY